jgi:hypothetical protein
MSVTLHCTSTPFVRCGKMFKISSVGGDSGSKKFKRAYGRSLTEPTFGGSLESGSRFCVGAIGRNLASVAVKMFSRFVNF